MARLSLYLAVYIASAAVYGLSNEEEKNFLNDGRGEGKILRVKDDLKKVAVSIRNLSVSTPGSKDKLAYIASDLMHSTESAVYIANQGIPYTKNKDIQLGLVNVVYAVSEEVHQIQHHVHGNPEDLRECIVGTMEKLFGIASKLAVTFRKSESGKEVFNSNQFRKGLNEGCFAVLKLKLEVDLFKKTNKELESEVDAGVATFCKSLQNVKGDNKKIREELIYFIQHIEQLLNRAVAKLENLVQISAADEKSIVVVKEVSRGLSTFYDTLHQLGCDNHEVDRLRTRFEEVYRAVTNLIKKLSLVDVGENTPEDLYVRSILMDSIAVSEYYKREINSHQDTKV